MKIHTATLRWNQFDGDLIALFGLDSIRRKSKKTSDYEFNYDFFRFSNTASGVLAGGGGRGGQLPL